MKVNLQNCASIELRVLIHFRMRLNFGEQAIVREKGRSSNRLMKLLSILAVSPATFRGALKLLRAILGKPSDELRWSIQFKELSPIVSAGLISGNLKL